MRDICLGVKSFAEVKAYHGDIQPANVYVLNNKSLKLIDTTFINDHKTGFIRKFNELDYFCPLSPQAMSGLVLGPDSAKFSNELNDVWATGNFFLINFKGLRF